jgi:exosortase N
MVLKRWKYAIVAYYLLIVATWVGTGYLPIDFSFAAGALLLPWLMVIRRGHTNWGYVVLALLTAIMSWYLPSRTLHFFTVAFALFFTWGSIHQGRIAWYPVGAVAIMSSLTTNWVLVFGFPIRLWLSEKAAMMLRLFDSSAAAKGNLIQFRGSTIEIEPACLGLASVQVALLFTLGTLALHERRTHLRLPYWCIAGIGVLTSVCILIYNLFRIILLCLFNWTPETIGHHVGGIFALILYVFLPVVLITQWATTRWGKVIADRDIAPPTGFNTAVQFILVGIITWIAISQPQRTLQAPDAIAQSVLNLDSSIYKVTLRQHGITQFYGQGLLIYTKPIPNFIGAEHSPMICWQGSGYNFKQGEQQKLPSGETYFSGILENPANELLYTAWWYDNGERATTSQLTWRWLDLSGSPNFSLVNVTAHSPEQLLQGVAMLRRKRLQ